MKEPVAAGERELRQVGGVAGVNLDDEPPGRGAWRGSRPRLDASVPEGLEEPPERGGPEDLAAVSPSDLGEGDDPLHVNRVAGEEHGARRPLERLGEEPVDGSLVAIGEVGWATEGRPLEYEGFGASDALGEGVGELRVTSVAARSPL